MKSEPKVEINHPKRLEKVIQRAYFDNDSKGRLITKDVFVEIDEDDSEYEMLKGMNNAVIKVVNHDIIDGTCRFIIEDSETLKLFPISMFCIVDENKKYTFY